MLVACGGGSSSAPPAHAVTAPPASTVPSKPSPAKLVTLNGRADAAGLHWIIVGEGFTAAQQAQLRDTARALARELMEVPELSAHTSVWNVHVLEADSRESGVDEPANSRYVDTAFDGKLGCGSNSRVACVDWDKIHATLLEQSAPAAQLTVVLNTTDYVGSSNSSGIIVSRHERAPRIAVHEMGHRVAGLADEYVDSVVAGEWLPYYYEGRFPNVTTVRDPSQAPWRHWVADGHSDVGLFEGAFYVSNGYYRPKQDSIMRTLDAPFGEVNAEAWLRAQYRSLPLLTSMTPSATQVRALAGETVELSVNSPWPPEVVSLRWFVDGIESVAARGATRFSFGADGATHQVHVEARDDSGRIRAPDAVEATAIRSWELSPTATATPGKAQRPQIASWIRVRIDATGHTVMGTHPARRGSTPLPPPGDPEWQYTLLDEQGAAVGSGAVADPRLVRTALSAPGEPFAGHATALLERGDYLVAIPQGVSPVKLRITSTAAGREKLGWTGTVPAAPLELALDLPGGRD
jgi:hypothetical protein